MPFINDILEYKSLSIAGLEKNTGKTECLNYVIKRLKYKKIALTSIGVDGEAIDIVTNTSKPEITIFKDMLFTTSEQHYRQRKVISEILDVSSRSTSLGRLITAKALEDGKVLLSGPADTSWLKLLIKKHESFGATLSIVDGALSRKSIASPAVTESFILATGAAVSVNLKTIVEKTKFVCELIKIPETDFISKELLNKKNDGIWGIDENGDLHDLGIESVFLMDNDKNNIFRYGNTIYVTGAVSDRFLNFLKLQKNIKDIRLIIRDFTKLFVTKDVYTSFLNKGGIIETVDKTKLIAVTVNPYSPRGYILNSENLVKNLQNELGIPVYDIRKIN